MFPGGIGMMEGLIILLVVLVLFGARRLPEVGEGLGKGIRSFKRSVAGMDDKAEPTIREKGSACSDPAPVTPRRSMERNAPHEDACL